MQKERMTRTRTSKYVKTVRDVFGMRYIVKNQNMFNRVRAIALLSEVLNKNEMRQFIKDIFDDYYPVNPVLIPYRDEVWSTLQHEMRGYFSFYEQDMWDLWYQYIYNNVMNYVFNSDNPAYETTLVNTTTTALKRFGKITMNRALQEVRDMSRILEEEVTKNPPVKVVEGVNHKMHILFVWKTQEDEKVCPICASLDGQGMLDIPETMPHLNCRCDFVVYEWWTDENGHVVADRRYDVEQNKRAKGDGFAVKQAKVTSEMQNGRQVTLFEVDDDGETHKVTYLEKDDEL